jgi:hypothetical protein
MFCVQCGSNIKDTANFCKYCGSKVKKSTTSATASNTPSLSPQPVSQPKIEPSVVQQPRIITKEESLFEKAILNETEMMNSLEESSEYMNLSANDPYLQDQSGSFDPITDETIDILYSRERESDIKEELKEILTDVEKIEQRMNIGLVSKNEAADQIQEKQTLIAALKSERKSLKNEKITIETLDGEIKELQGKLDKLHIIYNEGKISHESVYKKLKGEYEDGLSSKKRDYERQKNNLMNWLKILEFDVQKMKEDIDLTNTKADLGEIPKQEAESKQSELEVDIYRKELAYHALKAVQSQLKLL